MTWGESKDGLKEIKCELLFQGKGDQNNSTSFLLVAPFLAPYGQGFGDVGASCFL